MPSPKDKQRLLELLFEAKNADASEKAEAYKALHSEIDRIRAGTPFSPQQIKDFLYTGGYYEYARRRKLAEHNGV